MTMSEIKKDIAEIQEVVDRSRRVRKVPMIVATLMFIFMTYNAIRFKQTHDNFFLIFFFIDFILGIWNYRMVRWYDRKISEGRSLIALANTLLK